MSRFDFHLIEKRLDNFTPNMVALAKLPTFLIQFFLIVGLFSYSSAEVNRTDDATLRASSTKPSYTVLYKWKSLNIRFPSEELKAKLLASGDYIPKNNVMGGVRVYKDKIYVAISCFRPGIPVTLAVMDYKPRRTKTIRNPLLTAYPSYEFQEIGNCTCFQFIQQMEIDQFGRMWIIDSGRLDTLTSKPRNLCPPKLIIIDLNSGKILRSHDFPPNVASPTTAFLDDLVVACKSATDCYAFITNPAENLLTMYSLRWNRSWSVSHSSMQPTPSAETITILGINYTFSFGINGISISPYSSDFDTVYYSPISSYHLYSVSTKTLLKAGIVGGTVPLPDFEILDHGMRQSQADGMIMDSAGNMYYGRENKNGVITWKSQSIFVNSNTETQIAHSEKNFEWIDAFAFDNKGGLLVTSNRLNRFVAGEYDLNEYNFRIMRFTDTSSPFKSYMYPTTPKS